jgi:hypothetical protein
MSIARPKSTERVPPTEELKQQSILSSTKKKFVFYKLIGQDVKANLQWKVVEYILTECLPFNTV